MKLSGLLSGSFICARNKLRLLKITKQFHTVENSIAISYLMKIAKQLLKNVLFCAFTLKPYLTTYFREIMKEVDLDVITSKKIRTSLEMEMAQTLNQYKAFIDEEILVILGKDLFFVLTDMV